MRRTFEAFFATVFLFALSPLIICLLFITQLVIGEYPVFCQDRVGKSGKIFKIYKIKTIRTVPIHHSLSMACLSVNSIPYFCRLVRKFKLDELLQLTNIILGQMSFVGPRPDVALWIRILPLDQKKVILSVRPGLTSSASITYLNEEHLLSKEDNPIDFYRRILLPRKTALNVKDIYAKSISYDLSIVLRTLLRLSPFSCLATNDH